MNDLNDLKKAAQLLKSEKYTCVLKKGDSVYTSKERGVKPLLELVEHGKSFKGYSAADKTVGKAAAFLYVLLGVDCVYADIISVQAYKVLKENGIYADEYGLLTDAILNRSRTGFCPMETAVKGTDDPYEALSLIKNKLKEMNNT